MSPKVFKDLIKSREADHVVKLVRMECGMSQDEFANRVRVTQSNLSRYEKGKQMPSLPVIKRIVDFAKSFDILITVDDFFSEKRR